MKKILTVCSCMVFAWGLAFAQEASASPIDAADPARIGTYSTEQRLKEVSVDKFEVEGSWTVNMSADEGVIQSRLFDGAPLNKPAIEEEAELNLPDSKVLGVKVSFYRRGYDSFEIKSVKPLPVEGITKTVSVWVVGRSYPHMLNLIVEDYWGNRFYLPMGKLNFSGWKKMSVAIPPQIGDKGIVQKDFHYTDKIGLKIVGFQVQCDPWEAYGNYFIYLDDLRAVTDLYEIEARDPDDMSDNW